MQPNLSKPKTITFWITVGLVVLGILASQGFLLPFSSFAFFWLVVGGFVLLMLGNLIDNH
jgi:hypothetical protein